MYSIEVGDILEVRVNYQQSGQQLLNVFHYRYEGSTTITDGQAAVNTALTFFSADPTCWLNTWQSSASPDCICPNLAGQMIHVLRRPYYTLPGPFPGEGMGSTLPQNVQLGITKVGSTVGRGKTGRVEVPGITADMIADGMTTVTGMGFLLQLADAMLVKLPASVSETEAFVPIIYRRSNPAASEALTTTRAQDTVRVDHRRTVRVGK